MLLELQEGSLIVTANTVSHVAQKVYPTPLFAFIRRTFLLTMSINVYFLVVNDAYFVLTKHLFSISNFTIFLLDCFIVVVNIFGSIITIKNVKK
jgi:hypothetical protein